MIPYPKDTPTSMSHQTPSQKGHPTTTEYLIKYYTAQKLLYIKNLSGINSFE